MTASWSPFGSQVVPRTSEIRRIAALPRRVWSDEDAATLAAMLTRELKTPSGTMSLRPVQAVALYEAMETLGLFGPIRVGGGKTLLLFLLPFVLEAKRPVLLMPAHLLDERWKDYKALAEHWRLPKNLQFMSYEMLGLVQSARTLDYIKPDLIEADEGHYLKNHRAGRTKRVTRYMRENPHTFFAAVSGTVMKGSIKDFTHLLRWALKGGAPIPVTDDEVAVWADALDEKVNPLGRRQPGALFELSPHLDESGVSGARRVFQSRLLETRGVVASSKTDGVTCSLRVSALEYKPAAITEQHIDAMRRGVKDAKGDYTILPWTTPDGWAFTQAIEFRMYLRQLALGFHSIWSPRPPPEWTLARYAWGVFMRETLAHSRTLDTELQVANAVDAGRLGEEAREILAAWRGVRDTFKVQPKDVWHDDAAIQACAKWMEKHPGIVWCEHVFFARKLAALTGATYYGAGGCTDRGESITLVRPGKPIIASVQANGTGRNLQMFSQNLVTSCPPGASIVEQLFGRTHRDGQEADEVTVDILLGCREHHDAFQRALDGARAARDTLGHDQKLLLADVLMPTDVEGRSGPLWQ